MNKKFCEILMGTLLSLLSTLSHAGNYQDWWWDPQQSGMGFNVGHQGNTVVVAWYNYGEDGKASYLTMAGPLNGSVLKAGLYRGTGPAPGPGYSASQVKQTLVGEASITFGSDNHAQFNYSFDGKEGTLALERFTYDTTDITGTWNFVNKNTYVGCDNSGYNNQIDYGTMRITKKTAAHTYLLQTGSCDITFKATQTGAQVSGVGTFQCEDGTGGSTVISKLTVSDQTIRMNLVLTDAPPLRCIQEAVVTGLK
jgi:hypothetical protein